MAEQDVRNALPELSAVRSDEKQTRSASRGSNAGEPSSAALLGQRIRHARRKKGLTLQQLAEKVSRATSLLSQIENGKREPKLSMVAAIAKELDVSVEYLIKKEAPNERSALALELEYHQSQPMYRSTGLPVINVNARMSTDDLKAIVGLHRQLLTQQQIRAATPEKARIENRKLREEMTRLNNYMIELEELAGQITSAVGCESGVFATQDINRIADYVGYTVHQVDDLPFAARAVRDRRNKRIYMRPPAAHTADPRIVVLRNLAGVALGHGTPKDFGDFLRKRVEANYLATAILMPEKSSVDFLEQSKKEREMSVLNFAKQYQVGYETAAHRFTNLATEHLQINLHFDRISPEGIIYKAYANDGIRFPTDVTGAVEGQLVCRQYAARRIFACLETQSLLENGKQIKEGVVEDGIGDDGMYYQYTDTPSGTFFCTARIIETSQGPYSIGIGVPFEQSRWFMGRGTRNRCSSTCPDPACCRLPDKQLAERWDGQAFPEVRTHSHLLAAMPRGAFPGVDTSEVYEFLERHAD